MATTISPSLECGVVTWLLVHISSTYSCVYRYLLRDYLFVASTYPALLSNFIIDSGERQGCFSGVFVALKLLEMHKRRDVLAVILSCHIFFFSNAWAKILALVVTGCQGG